MTINDLLSIAQRGIPFTAADGQSFVRLAVPGSAGFDILPVRSPAYRNWFYYQFYSEFDTLPTTRAFHTVLNHLDAQANLNGVNERLSVFRRVGSRGTGLFADQILLDLATPERRFVEISPGAWTVTAGANALLQTSRSASPLPEPAPGPMLDPLLDPVDPAAPLEILRSCLNLESRADWLRCLAWLLAAFRPHGPFPFLILQGPPSSGKSFAARILRSLIDPSTAPLSPTPTSARDLVTLARHNWILALDHISTLSPALTDALCRLSSGLGAAVRETSPPAPEPLMQYYKRPVLLTVTSRWSAPADIAERALTVNCPPLDPLHRRAEAAILTTFSEAWPSILAALCSAVATALARLPQNNMPTGRCADALAWAIAAAPSLGCTEEEMRQAFDPPEPPHPMVQAIHALIGQRRQWTGNATQLLDLLQPALSCHTPTGLSRQLRTCSLTLADNGIEVNFRRRHEGARIIEVRANPGDASPKILPPHASPNPVEPSHPADSP